MKKTKEYKISVGLYIAALLLLAASAITGLIKDLNTSIDTICLFLGFACICFGSVFLKKAKDKSNEDK